jgi:hypothetical protein
LVDNFYLGILHVCLSSVRNPVFERNVNESLGDLSTIDRRNPGLESESAEPAEDAIAWVAVSLTGKERACTLLSQIGESL